MTSAQGGMVIKLTAGTEAALIRLRTRVRGSKNAINLRK